MKTASFKMTFLSGLMELAYSKKEVMKLIDDEGNDNQLVVIEDLPILDDYVAINEPENNLES